MPAKIRLADIIKGGGAEFVFIGSGAPIIISGGRHLTLELRVNEIDASIFLVFSDSFNEVEVCKGAVVDVTATYNGLIEELREMASPSFIRRHAKFLLGGVAGFAAAAVLAFAICCSSVPAKSQLAGMSPQNAEVLKFLDALTATMPADGSKPTKQGSAGTDATAPLLPPILEKPDFLQKPAIPTLPKEPVSEPKEAGTSAEPIAEAPSQAEIEAATGFPSYDPNAYKTDTVAPASEPEKALPDATEKKSEPAGQVVEDKKPTVEAVAEPAATVQQPEPAKEPEKAPESENQTEAAPTATPPSPVSDKSSEAISDPASHVVPREVTDKQAQAVVDSLMKGGMDKSKATDVIKTLEALASTDYTQITPEMISQLPHEVALMLRENGLIGDIMEPAYTDGVPHRIIRLPDNVVDQYRGKDGISSIPEANSWVATGNVVRIPPPGGGDLKSPEDFARFGIQAP